MTINDLDQVREWRNHPDVRNYMYTTHEISADEHRSWFEKASADPNKHLLIYEQAGIARGFANIALIRASDVAGWGFYLAPEAPKGSGNGLGVAVLDYAFEELHLHKVCGQALEFNERSVKFHTKMGFQQEGVLREQYFDGQKYISIICFGLLHHEWLKARGRCQ